MTEQTAIANYTVTITMSDETISSLVEEGNSLVAFSAVQGTDLKARPLVWFTAPASGPTFVLQWSAGYQAFATANIVSVNLVPGTPIRTGQTLNVGLGGIGTSSNEGTDGAITIRNNTRAQFTCGIKQSVNEVMSPVCAYPLFGSRLQTITPLPVIVLTFTTAPLHVGDLYGTKRTTANAGAASFAGDVSALAIDMSEQTAVSVGYDINGGWDCGTATWGQLIGMSNLVSTLIRPDPE